MASLMPTLVAVAREKRLTANAAALAFSAFNVTLTLSVLVYAMFTIFGTGTVLAELLHVLTGFGAVEFQQQFERLGGSAAGRRRAILIAVAISVWSAFRLVRAGESVFTEIYGIREGRSLRSRAVDSVLVLVAVVTVAAVMAVAGSLFVFRTSGWVEAVLSPVFPWLSICALFFPLYYRFSGTRVSVTEVLPGTAVAAAGWTVSAIVVRVYVASTPSADLYGIVGGVLLLLTWLYVVALAIVLGVILNALLAGRIEADREWDPFRD